MVIGSNNVPHGAYIGMVEQRDDGCFPGCSDLFRLIGSLTFTVALMLVCRKPRNDFDSNLTAPSVISGVCCTVDLSRLAYLFTRL